MRDNIPDALIAAFERQYDASWNDPQLRNERLAMRYGWAAAMEAKPCLHQIQEPAPATAMDALREAEAALEVAMARILKADPGHSICVTSEAKALVAVRAALAAPAPMLVAQPQLHAALFAARGALQHMKEGGKPSQSLLNEAIAAIDSVAVTEAAPAAVAEHGSREERMVVLQRGKDDIPTVWCDPEIADIVGALNSGGIKTVASCSGHGEKPGGIALADGRQLLLLDSLDAFNSAISTLCPSASAPAAVAVPENVREGAPYDNPAFEKLARELGVWGTAQSAICAQFWLAATPAEKSNSVEFDGIKTAAPVVLPEPDAAINEMMKLIEGYGEQRAMCAAAGGGPRYEKHFKEAREAEKMIKSKLRALLATGGQAQADMPDSFREWFAQNYPADTIIVDPDWHAKSIFRMAQAHARLAAPQAQADARDAELLDFLEANAASLTLEDGLWEIVVRGKTMNWATDGKTAREAIAAAKGK